MTSRFMWAGLGALAGVLAFTAPIEAFAGRGFGGGGFVGVHHQAGPIVRRAPAPVVRASVPAPVARVRVPAPVAGVRVPARIEDRLVRHHRGPMRVGVPAGLAGAPILGATYEPGDYPTIDNNPVYADPTGLHVRNTSYAERDDDPVHDRPSYYPACQSRDYVVPGARSERRQVRVLRC